MAQNNFKCQVFRVLTKDFHYSKKQARRLINQFDWQWWNENNYTAEEAVVGELGIT